MKGDSKVLQMLNRQLTSELTAINQYFLHARMYRNWGLKKLNEHDYRVSIHDMKAADRLIERILFLEGLPNLQNLGKLLIGENPVECIRCNLKLKMAGRHNLTELIACCEDAGDYVSRDQAHKILTGTEDEIDHLETQLDLIDIQGLENYLQAQMEQATEE